PNEYIFELIDRDTGLTVEGPTSTQTVNFYEFEDLAIGNYTANITTTLHGCSETVDFEIEAQSNLSATVNPLRPITSCEDGLVEITATGATGNVIYSINGNPQTENTFTASTPG